jgi:hypothetical protein
MEDITEDAPVREES